MYIPLSKHTQLRRLFVDAKLNNLFNSIVKTEIISEIVLYYI